jgi:hypothetical protein
LALGCSGTEAMRKRVLEKFPDKVFTKRAAVFIVPEMMLAVRRQKGTFERKPSAMLYTDENVLANRGEISLLYRTPFLAVSRGRETSVAAARFCPTISGRKSL